MTNILTRFWFEFEIDFALDFLPGIGLGCGVTAYDYDDAIHIMRKKMFFEKEQPPVKKSIENIDIRELDQEHVIPNMGSPSNRGIWFPLGYD